MKHPVVALEKDGEVGSVELDEKVFGLDPREDILQRMVVYQLAKRRAGTHVVQTRSMVSGTGAKWGSQKGSGRARHGSRKTNVFRGGGKAHGPVMRSHAIGLPRKVRTLALRHALSEKLRQKQLVILQEARLDKPKTSLLWSRLQRMQTQNALIVDIEEPEPNFCLAARNLPHVSILPVAGINVYDILRRDKLVLTQAALGSLQERFA